MENVAAPSSAVLADEAKRVRPGERLSDWLLRQPEHAQAFPLGLSWQVPAQQAPQAQLKHHLIAQLALSTELRASPVARQRLARWLKNAPITGRMPVSIADPRWLQAHPDQDPVLDYDHGVVLPVRPTTVTVITDAGQRCSVRHHSGAEALAYLRACQPDNAERIDRAWLVQPDGTVKTLKIAGWNAQAQDEPAPGARIWAPARDAGWTPRFSALFAEFLATQDPSADEAAPATDVQLPAIPAGAPIAVGPHARDPMVTANDWGLVGLMQTPSARMAEAGDMRFAFSRVYPYGRGNVLMQPLDWLETGFRYTNVSNRAYGAIADQGYKDKSIDVKVRLMKESATAPEVALGMTDIGGTGLFSSEYLVANKRSGDFDWSLGIAWGYLAGSRNIGNPLSVFGKGFDNRTGVATPTGGTVNTGSFFHGNTALFGGVQYQTPWPNVLLKLEYDGNNYQHEPQNNNHKQSSALNAGIVYRYAPSIDVTAGLERGNTFMLGVTLHTQLDKIFMPKLMDPPMPGVASARPSGEPDWARTVADLAAQTKWTVQQISRNGSDLRVVLDEAYGAYWNERIERASAVLHRDAPADIRRFVLVFEEHGVPMTERIVWRDAWVTQHRRYQAAAERFEAIAAAEPRLGPEGKSLWNSGRNRFSIGVAPSYQHILGGPDGFVIYRAGIDTPAELRLTDNTWISGKYNLRLIDNFDKLRTVYFPSALPRVRTDVREYFRTTKLTMPNLQVNHIGKRGDNQYYSVYGGYLEPMFAGVGGEWLYRPWHSPFAFGIDINRVQQRDFRQDFALRDYRANTGHATLYWDTGWKSTHVNLSAGQYLAGDRGISVDLSKTFNNGITLGAWATKTNISSQTFGEGSFDKGIYISFPFDAILPSLSPSFGSFVWHPLQRDGGAKLDRNNALYGLTSARDRRLSSYASANSAMRIGLDDEGPEWATERSIFGDLGKSTASLGTQVVKGQTGNALLIGGAMTLASSVFDRPMAKWANSHQTSRWNSLGKAANNTPLLLAAGTGMLWWGLGGDAASETAWTAIKSAALTLGAETLTKLAVGRARPDENLGTMHFSPVGKGAANSGFPSIHMGAAYALVTPFAQQYDAPWLYGIAGITAFGRIQQRQHFVSDTVAGSLIGYGIGSLLLDQQRSRRGVPRIAFGTNRSIQATWDLP